MRTFYIFNINKEFAILTKDSPYNLYKTLESVYYLDKTEVDIGCTLFDQVAYPFKVKEVNNYLIEAFRNNDFYTVKGNIHKIYNKYREESLEIEVHNTYMFIKTNMNKKEVFQNLLINNNLFVCDFKNKDYFWLSKILSYN